MMLSRMNTNPPKDDLAWVSATKEKFSGICTAFQAFLQSRIHEMRELSFFSITIRGQDVSSKLKFQWIAFVARRIKMENC